ncbi:MAG: TetR/AcrR family transcriptional regulator [Paenibacillaceae bacterium]|jgi:AcrR family transcriptional regulator|nr:TetR/AcrR family transcriptional regulator [Paenibacillaceae bacterium]
MPIRRDAIEHRKHILKTAKALFLSHGVDQVNMHQIAKTAGIGQGTLYRNYASKADLCLEIMKESSAGVEDELRLVLENNKTAPVSWMLEQALNRLLDYVEEKSQWLGVVQSSGCSNEEFSYYRSSLYEAGHLWLSKLLEEAVRRGECRENLDPVFTADAILAASDPDLFTFLRNGRGYSLQQLKENFKCLYLDPLFNLKG